MTTPKLSGLIAAPFTALHPDGSLNLEQIVPQADHLVTTGVGGAFVCGTTGEGLSLTTAERERVAERWVKAAAKRLKVIVHVGHNSLDESRHLAAHAVRAGADAVATHGPTFFRPASVRDLVEFCAGVAAAAPDLPFYFYHIPVMTGVHLPMPEFLALGARRIPNLAGIKFTDENLMSFSQCLHLDGGRFNLLFGRDEILLAALALGATGAVGSTYNYIAPVYHRLWDAFTRGDLVAARRHQWTALQIIAVMIRHGGLPAGKAMMGFIGLECGPVRPPLRTLTGDQIAALRRELESVGFPLREAGPLANEART